MRIHRLTATGIAALGAALLLSLGAGTATAATNDTCTGDGPASTLSARQHEEFDARMTELKKERNAIMAKYRKSASTAARGQRSGQKARATRTKLTTAQRAEKRAALAAWKLERDALFTEYKLTARTQGHGA